MLRRRGAESVSPSGAGHPGTICGEAMRQLDEIDRKLLALLQENDRLALADLSQSIGVAASTINDRIRRLVSHGGEFRFRCIDGARVRRRQPAGISLTSRSTRRGCGRTGEMIARAPARAVGLERRRMNPRFRAPPKAQPDLVAAHQVIAMATISPQFQHFLLGSASTKRIDRGTL